VTLWEWAGEAWRRPGVEALCLELQDARSQSAPYLLWAAWAAAAGRHLNDEQLATGAAIARAWDEDVIGHLRAARRALRAPAEGDDTRGFSPLRAQVKAAELAAERLLMESLELMTPPRSRAPDAPAPALERAARAFGGQVPDDLLAKLAERLPV
jgi:uncharacterized protein (TIGR02444 family)